MSNVNDGGPAFPQAYSPEVYVSGGMTLRDYFASDAMAALLACKSWREDMDADQTARAAYRQADAMLAAK